MKRRIIHDISASSLQVIVNQLAGLMIFFIASKYLSKTIFGELSWALAIIMVGFSILGCGIDQITVRKIAAGEEPASLLKVYLFHVLLAGAGFLILLLIAYALSGAGHATAVVGRHFTGLSLLLFLAIGQFFIFLSLPFKQIANGKEQFRVLLFMSTGANAIKVSGLLFLAWSGSFTLSSFLLIYVLASAAELLVCIYMGRRFLALIPGIVWDRIRYARLVRESLPQLGVILCTAGIARFDWIFLGIMATAPILAEYSFAYKAFEMASLPLLVLAPLLLPRITRWVGQGGNGIGLSGQRTPGLSGQRKEDLYLLARFEMILSCSLCLILNILWAPVIDWLTDNKYGAVNSTNIFFLSCSLPFLYINNILWSIHFAKGRMKFIFFVFMVTLLITCTGDLLLIPFLRGEGAAIAYLAAMIAQTVHFTAGIQKEEAAINAGIGINGGTGIGIGINRMWQSLLLCGGAALFSGWLAMRMHEGAGARSLIAIGLYLAILFVCRQIRLHDWITCKRFIYA